MNKKLSTQNSIPRKKYLQNDGEIKRFLDIQKMKESLIDLHPKKNIRQKESPSR